MGIFDDVRSLQSEIERFNRTKYRAETQYSRWMQHAEYRLAAAIYAEYQSGRSLRDLADEMDCSHEHVRKLLKRNGFSRRERKAGLI